MVADQILQLGMQFGAAGVLCGYLVWRDCRNDRWRREFQQDRLEADKAETTSREKLASALTALSMFIQGKHNV